jgi:hypothetical protein
MKILCFFYIVPSWIRIRIQHADSDPNPATQINAIHTDQDLDPQPCL